MDNYDEKLNYSFEPADPAPADPAQPLQQAKEEIRRSGRHTGLKIAALLTVVAIVAATGGYALKQAIAALGEKNLAGQQTSVDAMAEQTVEPEPANETAAQPTDDKGAYRLERRPLPDTLPSNDTGKTLTPTQVYQMNVGAVCGIATQVTTNVWGQTTTSACTGSGFVLTEDGYIVTNNHVVDGASKLKVKLNDGRSFDAKLIGKDSATDLALLKIEAEGLPTLAFGSSDALRLGEWVLAIGSPFDLQSTITAGIVSAKARQLGVIPNDFRIEAFIQTDAAVNPGNSGGALVNTHGELVGINTLIKSQTGSYVGYSFAIPESIVRKVVVDLKEVGVVQRALLGVQFRVVDQDFLDTEGKELGIKDLGGAYVAAVVEGGAASEAGIRKGDVILDIDGVKIVEPSTLQEQIAKRRPNDTVKLSVKRDGKVKQFDVTLRNKAGKTELVTKEDVDVVDALGGKFADAGAKLCRELDIKGGVQVVGIKADGILARARVKQGFVITHINDRPVYSLGDMQRMTEKVRSIDGVYPNGRSASYTLVE